MSRKFGAFSFLGLLRLLHVDVKSRDGTRGNLRIFHTPRKCRAPQQLQIIGASYTHDAIPNLIATINPYLSTGRTPTTAVSG